MNLLEYAAYSRQTFMYLYLKVLTFLIATQYQLQSVQSQNIYYCAAMYVYQLPK